MRIKCRILSSCLILVCQLVVSQIDNTSDTLLLKTFNYLDNQFKLNLENSEKATIYIDAYIKKAKQQQIDSLILEGYYSKAFISNSSIAIAYYDSIINYDSAENSILPYAHEEKGYVYFDDGNYKESLGSYLEARKLAKEIKNDRMFYSSTHSIGVIKALNGQNKEALKIYKEQFKNFSSNYALKTKFSSTYMQSLFSLADSYIENAKLDSATIYNKLGIQESLKLEKPSYYPMFVLSEGITLYKKEAYEGANDSISKAIKLFNQLNDIIFLPKALYFKAKIISQSGDLVYAIELLKKADTLVSKQSIRPDFSPIYESLYENYKKTDSVEQQLIYLEKFIDYNKRLEKEFKGIDATLYTQYDVPELLNAKEEIIVGLQKKDKINQRSIFLLSVFLTGFGILSYYYYRKRVIYKKRYDKLFQQDHIPKKLEDKKSVLSKPSKVPPEILEELLPKIQEFEEIKGFLNSSLTLNKMAKALGSNSNYLSKTINYSKSKNFSSYLSDLRITYALQELKTNEKLRNYTIKAIAAEVGFGNAESFTKAFYAKTNLYPSYFIKQLKKDQQLTQDS